MGTHDTHELSAKGERRRNQILDAALGLFGDVGYGGTSLRDVATRAGITHPGLLYHFRSKEHLLQEVLERREAREIDRVGVGDGTDAVVRLQSLMELVEFNQTTRVEVQLFATLSSEATDASHPAHDFFLDRYQRAVAGHRAMFANLRERGLLRPGVEPDDAARLLVALMDGLQVQWLYDPTVPMARLVREVTDAWCVRPIADLV